MAEQLRNHGCVFISSLVRLWSATTDTAKEARGKLPQSDPADPPAPNSKRGGRLATAVKDAIANAQPQAPPGDIFRIALCVLQSFGHLPTADAVCAFTKAVGCDLALPNIASLKEVVPVPGTNRYIAIGELKSWPPRDAARILALSVSHAADGQTLVVSSLAATLTDVWGVPCDEDDLKAEFAAVGTGDDDDLPCRRSCAVDPGTTGDVEDEDAAALDSALGPDDATKAPPLHVGDEDPGKMKAFLRFLEIPGAFTMAYPHLFIAGAGDYTMPRVTSLPGGFKRYLGYLLRYQYQPMSQADLHLRRYEHLASRPSPACAGSPSARALWSDGEELPAEWFQVRPHLSSPFEQDETFVLFAFSLWFKQASTAMASVALKADPQLQKMTRDELIEKLEARDPWLMNKIWLFSKSLPNTKAFWQSQLKAFSAAGEQWPPPLLHVLD